MIDLKDILYKHQRWLCGYEDGERANLREANLRRANLRGADLYGADLREANLRRANLRGADLYGADLYGADLYGANLREANLREANLRRANLREANLRGAKNIDKVYWDMHTAFYPLQCPESGSFIGYKKAQNKIVVLEICEDALRSSATTRKCRCSKAKVLRIEEQDGRLSDSKVVHSSHDFDFIYEVGKIVSVDNFDIDRWNECSTGIHFFITRDEAVKY